MTRLTKEINFFKANWWNEKTQPKEQEKRDLTLSILDSNRRYVKDHINHEGAIHHIEDIFTIRTLLTKLREGKITTLIKDAKTLLIMEGLNDILRQKETPNKVYDEYKEVVKEIRKINAAVEIYTIEECTYFKDSMVNNNIKIYNLYLENGQKEFKYTFIKQDPYEVDKTTDGLHINQEQGRLLARKINATIKQHKSSGNPKKHPTAAESTQNVGESHPLDVGESHPQNFGKNHPQNLRENHPRNVGANHPQNVGENQPQNDGTNFLPTETLTLHQPLVKKLILPSEHEKTITGRIIGYKGETVKQLQEKYDVQIQVRRPNDQAPYIRICGQSQDNIGKVTKELQALINKQRPGNVKAADYPCYFYPAGDCVRGENCKYRHDEPGSSSGARGTNGSQHQQLPQSPPRHQAERRVTPQMRSVSHSSHGSRSRTDTSQSPPPARHQSQRRRSPPPSQRSHSSRGRTDSQGSRGRRDRTKSPPRSQRRDQSPPKSQRRDQSPPRSQRRDQSKGRNTQPRGRTTWTRAREESERASRYTSPKRESRSRRRDSSEEERRSNKRNRQY